MGKGGRLGVGVPTTSQPSGSCTSRGEAGLRLIICLLFQGGRITVCGFCVLGSAVGILDVLSDF